MGKATKAQMEDRIAQALRMMRKGYTRANILQYAAKKWGVEQRATDEVIKKATDRLKLEFKAQQDSFINDIVFGFDHIYQKALKGSPRFDKDGNFTGNLPDLHAAIAAKREKAKVLGLHKTVIGLDSSVDLLLDKSDDELEELAAHE